MNSEYKTYLEDKAREIRRLTLECIHSIGSGHIGGSLSVAELLAVLYFDIMNIRPEEPDWQDRDRFVLSKGHAGPALYSTLAMKDYFPRELLYTLNQPESLLPSHCDRRRTRGIDMTTGSLGQGASSACGLALAQKLDGHGARTYVAIGDGEAQEGEVWEAFLFAAQQKLSNLTAFLDCNKLQVDGNVDDICSLGDIAGKFTAFGLEVREVNGHDVEKIDAAVREVNASAKPGMVILHTKKGRGVSEFEDKRSCHSAAVTDEILKKGLAELNGEEATA